MDEPRLWSLLIVVENACSDDETDTENTSPRLVRRLKWRSDELLKVLQRLDDSQVQLRKSLTPSTSSPNRGRPSRARVRRDNAPLSKLSAPKNLPRDCYSQTFPNGLTPQERAPLNVDSKDVLPGILLVLDDLGF